MRKYIANRLLRSIFSISIVIVIVYILIYSLVPKEYIFDKDPDYQKKAGDVLTQYVYKTYEEYGYGDCPVGGPCHLLCDPAGQGLLGLF